jgi:hypothetical protein
MTADAAIPGGGSALRLTFRVDGDQLELIDQERVEMAVLPSEELEQAAPRSGYWHELQDGDGNPIYRRMMGDPLPRQVEVPTGDPSQPLAWQGVERRSGVLSVVVPDVPEGRSVVFLGSRPESVEDVSRTAPELLLHRRAFETTEIARFELRQEG